MNINWKLPFGIQITRGTTETPDDDFELDPRQLGQPQQLARAQIKNIARNQIAAVKKIEHGAHKLTVLILWVSIPHQMLYVMDKTILDWGTFNAWLYSLAALTAAAGLPFVCDWLTVLCVRLVGAPVSRWYARAFGFVGMLPAIAGSSWINLHAPGDKDIRTMIGTMVLAIPIAQGVRAFAQHIAWKKLRKMEEDIAEQVDISTTIALPTVGKPCTPGCTCGKHTPAHRKAPSKPTTKTGVRKTRPAAKKPAPASAPADPGLDLLDDAAATAAALAIAEAETLLAEFNSDRADRADRADRV